MHRLFIATLFILIGSVVISSCDLFKKNDKDTSDSELPELETELVESSISSEVLDILGNQEIEIVSPLRIESVENADSFTFETIKPESYQIIPATLEGSEEPVLMGLYDPETEKVEFSARSTAISMLMINPMLAASSSTLKSNYVDYVTQTAAFHQLVESIENSWRNDPENALNYENNPAFYQQLAELMIEAVTHLEAIGKFSNQITSIGQAPRIEAGNNGEITFINPRFKHYAAGIYKSENREDIVRIKRRVKMVQFGFNFDDILDKEAETPYELADGDYRVHITSRMDLSKLLNFDEEVGISTRYNLFQTLWYLLDIVLSLDDSKFDIMMGLNLESNILRLSIPGQMAKDLSESIYRKDVGGAIITFSKIAIENADNLLYLFFQTTGKEVSNPRHYISMISNKLKDVAIVFKILGFANKQAPFFFDLVTAPKEIDYYLQQSNGQLTQSLENNPPTVELTIQPEFGSIDTEFLFDASETFDDFDSSSDLEFRWDFDSDGNWDKDWSSNSSASHQYIEFGSYAVTCEARDATGLISSATKTVNVGGGNATADRIVIFRDAIAWDDELRAVDYGDNNDALIRILESLGFQEGMNSNEYVVYTSNEMTSISLDPSRDLVIISNDQPQSFYDNYELNQLKFSNFVYSGGSIFWGACDRGWNNGSINISNLLLPSNIQIVDDIDGVNFVVDSESMLTQELPNQLDHNYASHLYFNNLPDFTTVYITNSDRQPTLIEANLGSGWMIMGGMPMEHQYRQVYQQRDLEELLPRVIAYFTGKEYNGQNTKSRLLFFDGPTSSR